MTGVAHTSVAAFYSHVNGSKASGQRADIVSFIARNGGDWSIGELSKAMGLQKSTLSAQIRECLDAGELVEAPKRRDGVSGITVRPVKIPAGQGELFQ